MRTTIFLLVTGIALLTGIYYYFRHSAREAPGQSMLDQAQADAIFGKGDTSLMMPDQAGEPSHSDTTIPSSPPSQALLLATDAPADTPHKVAIKPVLKGAKSPKAKVTAPARKPDYSKITHHVKKSSAANDKKHLPASFFRKK